MSLDELDPPENTAARREVQRNAERAKPGPWYDSPEILAEKLRKKELDQAETALRVVGEEAYRKLGRHFKAWSDPQREPSVAIDQAQAAISTNELLFIIAYLTRWPNQ